MDPKSLVEQVSKLVIQVDRPSPFDKLATGIIANIFSAACPHVDFPGLQLRRGKRYRPINRNSTDPAVLSMVCRRWRDTTIMHQSLWANIVINASRISSTSWEKRGIVQLRARLLKSGVQPLTIRIDDHPNVHNSNLTHYSMISKILDIVIAHSKRWHTITFDFPFDNESIGILNSLEGQLPLLKSLEIFPSECNDGTVALDGSTKVHAFLSAPALNRLCLGGPKISETVCIPWTQISEFTFDYNLDLFEDDFREIMLYLASSVKILTFSRRSMLWVSTNENPITLPKLQELYFWNNCKSILDILICPSLGRLRIEDGDNAEIKRFLERSSRALIHIHLPYFRDDREVGRVMQDTEYYATLQKLSLSTLQSLSLFEVPDEILDLLVFDSQQFFPSLETLYVDLRFEVDDTHALSIFNSRVERLQRVVESRTQVIPDAANSFLKSCFFTFRLLVWPYYPLNTEFLEKLRLFCISRHVFVQLNIQYYPTRVWLRSRNRRNGPMDSDSGRGFVEVSDKSHATVRPS